MTEIVLPAVVDFMLKDADKLLLLLSLILFYYCYYLVVISLFQWQSLMGCHLWNLHFTIR